ncbi:MAG: hypothetical protein Q8918_02660 [Bacteroidota bacterium]|nr:hypothetical protein [Bacteroidota bacterium]MDP4213966.1 hypothetical protein [Bacteroidota bacterium]MDP4248991.1 hypothetical protein [Bacteroidota bacterium]
MKPGVMPFVSLISAVVFLFILRSGFSNSKNKSPGDASIRHPFFLQGKNVKRLPETGSILGIVVPLSVKTSVFAVSVSDTMASTFTDTTNGAYILKDIPPGNYALIFVPSDHSYNKNSCRAAVSDGQITIADTIWLLK